MTFANSGAHGAANQDLPSWTLVVHGGSDPRPQSPFSPEEDRRRYEAMAAALRVGEHILAGGGSSLDAVQAAVRTLEDAPDFNAGRGAELAHEGHAELDASIMDGRDRRAGAVAGLRRVKNPIDLARCVMEKGGQVLLIGEGAEKFAVSHGVELVDPQYFITEQKLTELREALERQAASAPQDPAKMSGTVGAVALDSHGNLAAATSTGGITNKHYGRVGDSPLVGAGTYAENGVCAVSSTGWGEFFIRSVAAHELCARIKYANESVQSAAQRVVEAVKQLGGYGGVIAVDAKGCIATPHTTPRMAYGYSVAGRRPVLMLSDR